MHEAAMRAQEGAAADPAPASALLRVENLVVDFQTDRATVQAVRGVSFSVAPGETLAIVGESGSGKSVTALSIMRLVERENGILRGGAMHLLGSNGETLDLATLAEPAMRRLRGNTLSMVFQEPMTSLNPVMTIGEQLAEVLMLHQGRSRAEALGEAVAMLAKVRIPDPERRLSQYPHELSGGMRQRVMIAMALFCRPRLLIADEPTTALDVTVQAEILELIRKLQAEIGMAVIFITHDMGVVAEMADRVLVMRHGEAVEEGDVREIFARPRHPYTKALLAAVPRLGEGDPGQGPAPEARAALAVEGLVKRFPVRKGPFRRLVARVHAVENVSFALKEGETLGLVGESGCGKSTTGRAVLRLIEATEGRIEIAGRDIGGLSRRELTPLRQNAQMIFQDPYASLNPRLSAFEAVTEPLAIHHPELSRQERWARGAALLERVGLSAEHLSRYPHQFSGGQRQRLCIARALSVNPRLIVADEPVSALDVSIRAQVMQLMKDLQRDLGLAYLFISHDMAVIEAMSHRVAVMYLGQIVEMGPTKAVLHDARHPYTRRLLASVPVPDPTRRALSGGTEAREIPSPVRALDDPPRQIPLVEVAPGHFVQPEA